jgi:hypothetical protein
LTPGTFFDANVTTSATVVGEKNYITIEYVQENPSSEISVQLADNLQACGPLIFISASPIVICVVNPASVQPIALINLTTPSDFISLTSPFEITPGTITNMTASGNMLSFTT